MKYFLLAGEASGDVHGSNLAKAINQQDEHAEIIGWGGEKMEEAGVDVRKHYKDVAIMGFVEVLFKLKTIYKNFRKGVRLVKEFQPDAVILIDFSGFNLRFAKRLRKKGFQGNIFYYISPKLWVWNSRRVKSIKKYVDAVFCILPFEEEFYKQQGYEHAEYIGNPIMDEIEDFSPNEHFMEENDFTKPIIALLPGSRENEIKHVLPSMLTTVEHFPDYQFVIAGVKSLEEMIQQFLNKNDIEIPIIYNQTYDLVLHSELALVTSGTATLETALLGTPLILCYKGNSISFLIAEKLVNIDFIGLPNLIMNREIVKELIQSDLKEENLVNEMNLLLNNSVFRKRFFSNQERLVKRVGHTGASEKTAKLMIEKINKARK